MHRTRTARTTSMVGISTACAVILLVIAGDVAWAQSPPPRLNENCIVSVLNRNTRVRPDGTWVLPNIPANFGLVRARATCVFNGQTTSGESAPFLLVANGSVNVPPIVLGSSTPIPSSLTVTTAAATLSQLGATTTATVLATYPGIGGNPPTTQDVTLGSFGTRYIVSNSAIATITGDGLVSALASGTVLIQATNEGTAGFTSVRVVLTGDTDADGIPDDVELTLGLNPNNAADAAGDLDVDGLSNLNEYLRGTDARSPDSDGDGIYDGEETVPGADGVVTNPLAADSDGDGVRDGLEIASGSDPNNPLSLNLGKALSSISVTPENFTIIVNSVQGEGSRQLTVTGALQDGTTINLTSTTRGTNYLSSNLDVCDFGFPDGRVFGGQNGPCTITVTNSGHTDTATGSVTNFTPVPLGFVNLPGYANNVDVAGNFAYVAAGAAGLQIVNVSNRAAPVVVAAFDTPGNANDVRVLGNFAYVADGGSGLQIINITNPLAPQFAGSVETPGVAWDVAVSNNRAFVADGDAGLAIIDVTNPAQAAILGSVNPPGTQKGVAIDPTRNIAVLASGTSGVHVIDVSNPAAPAQIAAVPGGDVRDVELQNNYAFLADYERSLTSLDLSVPATPILRGSTPLNTGGRLHDVVVQGNFSLGADVLFVNGVPIVAIDAPETPIPRAILNFSALGDSDGQGIAADAGYVYLAAVGGSAFQENGTTASGNNRLYIGQYVAIQDLGGVPPTVTLVQPTPGISVIEGTRVTVRATASDDVAVAAVTFLANGVPVVSDSSEPYEVQITAPAAPGPLVLSARAIDFGNNTSNSQEVSVVVTPDPLTTARGVVRDVNNQPVAGATVTVLTSTALTQSDGSFVIQSLPTTQGAFSARAVVVVNGVTLRGGSPAAVPVPSGFTELGTIIVRRGGRLFATSSQQGTNQRSVFIIETDTGVPTLVGAPSPVQRPLSDVSFNPITGVMYVMHGSSSTGCELLTVDPGTAQILSRVTVTSNVSIQGCDAIAHDANGVLYVGVWAQGRLLTVNPATGVALTDIPITGGGTNNHAADLAFDPTTGELWAARGGSLDGRIVRINPQTAAVTRILDIPPTGIGQEVTAIAFDIDGQMFVSISGDRLAKVNKETGAFTFVGTGFNGAKIAGLGFEQ
jgi:hypothetical protein